ncbi:TadE/TadG family type IV pilus assembly protein [Thalassotalea crassostreae]|uniref:TadE/TadG family type IV pilus assembly protein n=1 Tax=Thalassotalea crassostreae TaxID=1763536 RepID=UPI00083895BC|nr:TadE/TadG family type IV pilus assembly protein [Thalassotalea crassostreae]
MKKQLNSNKTSAKSKQAGLYTVEFAIVGSLFFLLFFAAFEIARLMFTLNVLTEASRRGARLLAVCPLVNVDEAANDVAKLASFDEGKLISQLTSDNILVKYLTFDGVPATSFSQIRLVRVEIRNFEHSLIIPGLDITLNSPSFATTIPRESLGETRWDDSVCN